MVYRIGTARCLPRVAGIRHGVRGIEPRFAGILPNMVRARLSAGRVGIIPTGGIDSAGCLGQSGAGEGQGCALARDNAVEETGDGVYVESLFVQTYR